VTIQEPHQKQVAYTEFFSATDPMPDFIQTTEEFNEVIKGLVVIDFTAAWCGPCKAIAPKFAAMAEKYTDIKFFKVDVDDLEDVAATAGINAMPTFQVYHNGEKVAEVTGANPTKLEEMIQTHAGKKEGGEAKGEEKTETKETKAEEGEKEKEAKGETKEAAKEGTKEEVKEEAKKEEAKEGAKEEAKEEVKEEAKKEEAKKE